MSIRFHIAALCITALIIGTALPAGAQTQAPGREPAQSRTLHLQAATVDTRALPNLLEQVPPALAPDTRYVMQLDGPMTSERREDLRQTGVQLGDYLPDHAYIVRLPNVSPQTLAAKDYIEWIGEYRREWKTDPQIGQRLVPFETPERAMIEAAGKVQLIVSLFQGEDPDAAIETALAAGAEIIGGTTAGNQGLIDLVIDADRVAALADIGAVQFVEEAPELKLRNDTTYWIVQSNVNGQAPIWDQGIHGEGQIGGIIDGPVKESHCSFDDTVAPGPSHRKIVYYAGAIGADSHGTHVAGTMAGDQSPYGQASYRDGMAFAAKLTFIPVSPIYSSPSTFINRLQDAYDNGARAHSNSWGDDGTTSYTTWCRQIDQFSRDNEEALVAFAVTNTSSLRTPENAKNVLAVGASQDAPNQHNHCTGGAGPTADGRRKPEIYAPGCSTYSSDYLTTCGWRAMTGTSMACPAVSGMALLARQYYTDGYYPSGSATPADGFTPTGALLRATIINAGVDMTGVSGYPSNTEGWGRLLLDNTLFFPGDARALYVEDVWNADGLSTGQQTDYYVEVVDDSVPLRVTLVWTDVPAAVGSASPAINNLDLQVEDPVGTVYLGNDFNTTTGESKTGGGADTLNNVEQVHRHTPALGGYFVRVLGTAVNQETQGYALVVTGGIQIVPPDCNGNGVPDDQDIAGGTSEDCDGNGRPDECQPDCDGDAVPDACSPAGDCNANGIPDDCDISFGTSGDCNDNVVPDECDVAAGTSEDCNNNAVPDECDISAGTSEDCNQNGAPDECDLVSAFHSESSSLSPFHNSAPQSHALSAPPTAFGDITLSFDAIADLNDGTEYVDVDINGTYVGTIYDTQANQCPADADVDSLVVGAATFNALAGGGAATINMMASTNVNDICPGSYIAVRVDYDTYGAEDCNANGIPDECEEDCNQNDVPDDCDIAEGTSLDGNSNGVPDECEVPRGDGDCDEDGDVDLGDFATFAVCFTGPGGQRAPGCLCSDFNGDGDVDLDDFSEFALWFQRGVPRTE